MSKVDTLMEETEQNLLADQFFDMGWENYQQGAQAEAQTLFEMALELCPDHLNALLWSGILAYQQGRYSHAETGFRQLVSLAPDLDAGHYNLALTLQAEQRFIEAEVAYRNALNCHPGRPETWNNLGTLLLETDRYAEAQALYEQLVQQAPDYTDAWFNLGVTLASSGKYAQAIPYYQKAIQQQPEYSEAQFALAVAWLACNHWELGWPQYEWRWRHTKLKMKRPETLAPAWDGQADIQQRRFVLDVEQGYGDTLQFCRFATELAARGAEVVLRAPPELQELLTSLTGISEVLPQQADTSGDFQMSLMSLPAALELRPENIPAADGYLTVSAELRRQWRHWLGPARRPRIGLVWAGNPQHDNDRHRSLPLATLLAGLPSDYDYLVLQTRLSDEERATLATQPTCRIPELPDFAATAALCSELDLVISIDSAVAHLCGALGLPVWILLAKVPDWRWPDQGIASRWYRSARLFRQSQAGNWAGLLARLSVALSQHGLTAKPVTPYGDRISE